MRKSTWALAAGCTAALMLAAPTWAAVIGQNTPALSISADRIAALPASQRAAWSAYLDKSQAQMRTDRASLAAELKPGQTPPPQPPENSDSGMPLNKDAAWYANPEARHVADVIVSFQTPAGGWSKNQSRAGALRLPGQPYAADNLSKHPSVDDFDTPRDPQWNYVGTLDNNATITEMRFLAKVAATTPDASGDAYRASFIRGARYLLAAQFPNGGWPQVYPLEGNYHDDITYNDNAVAQAAQLLTEVAKGQGDFAFAPADLRAAASGAEDRAIACILATQVVVGGRRTIWGQQQDALTLKPTSARNYEPPELAASESSDLLIYLMGLPNPSPAVVAAVKDGVAYLKSVELHDVAYGDGGDKVLGRRLLPTPGAVTWARFYQAASGKPIFGDRDKSLHDDVADLSAERRNGYSWYNAAPQKALDAYAVWSKAHP